jgi:CheY-like chemotaxis protein
VLGDVLEASGHQVVVLTDGAEAIARVQKEAFDVVFTDLAMPRVSGWDVAHAVKASAPGVPVFLVTGFGVELSPAERRAHGVAEVFSKPLRIEDVTRAVAHAGRHAGPRARPEDHA